MLFSGSKSSSKKNAPPLLMDGPSIAANDDNTKRMLPILIIPGFMSSGLEIKESKTNPGWVGKRIWLNLSSIGISAMFFGNAQKKQTYSKMNRNNDDDDDDYDAQQHNYKSAWFQHIMLDMKDFKSDPPGLKVRPIPGLEGVDYLTPGAITSHISYVFGPIIKALKRKGYNSNGNVNLMASTYDWRLAPLSMEKRDKYFTRTVGYIEELFIDNNSTPVVILAHSLGCKVAHYFLNFALDKEGQKWIDKHIHTYMVSESCVSIKRKKNQCSHYIFHILADWRPSPWGPQSMSWNDLW